MLKPDHRIDQSVDGLAPHGLLGSVATYDDHLPDSGSFAPLQRLPVQLFAEPFLDLRPSSIQTFEDLAALRFLTQNLIE